MFSTRGIPTGAAEGLVGCQRLIIEHPVIFISHNRFGISRLAFSTAQAPLAAVAGDVLSAAVESG